MRGVDLSHHDGDCSFETILSRYELDDPVLWDIARIEHRKPRLVSAHDTASADTIVNIGCDRSAIPTDKTVIEWDVPLLTQDFAGATAAIHELAESLALMLAESTLPS